MIFRNYDRAEVTFINDFIKTSTLTFSLKKFPECQLPIHSAIIESNIYSDIGKTK
jgi:hypothetical protein